MSLFLLNIDVYKESLGHILYSKYIIQVTSSGPAGLKLIVTARLQVDRVDPWQTYNPDRVIAH